MSVLKDFFQQVQLLSILQQLNYLADFLLSWNELWLFIISGPFCITWTVYFNPDPSMLLSYFFNFLIYTIMHKMQYLGVNFNCFFFLLKHCTYRYTAFVM